MAIKVKDMLLTNHNRCGKKLIKLKGIVIHWTANTSKGANAMANRNYFNSTKRAASAHYIVDDESIIRCIPDEEVAYHVGAKKYTTGGIKIKEANYSPNFFLIGIEMCVNSDGDWNKTYKNTIELAAYLLKKYDMNIENLYRHFDITGKDCPKMMLDSGEWDNFKKEVCKIMNGVTITVNKELIIIDKIIRNNKIYAPIRDYSKILDTEIWWDGSKMIANIKTSR